MIILFWNKFRYWIKDNIDVENPGTRYLLEYTDGEPRYSKSDITGQRYSY